MFFLQSLSIIGFLLSLYALYVEYKVEKEASYKAVCDINNRMSCTKAFTSKYGKILGISNAYYGVVYYLIVFVLTFTVYSDIIFYLAILGGVGSIYLAYILYFKLKDICVVCTSVYVVNVLMLSYFFMN
jgi:vitamin-K-epoxide reductase (warfarin-sensitive)